MISSRRDLSPFAVLSAVIVLLLATTPAEAAWTSGVTARTPRTTLELTIVGCDGCRVHPVQNKDGDLTYGARPKTTRDAEDTLVFTVPRARTRQMAFLVYAPFDELARAGMPAVTAVGFRGKRVGSTVGSRYVGRPRPASGCWGGVDRRTVRATFVVRRVTTRAPLLGPGRYVTAAVHAARTMVSRPYYVRAPKNALHASDPSICR